MQKISISGALSSIGFDYFKDGTLSTVATIDPLVVDVNSDGVDELLFAGFESQPNSPANYDNVSMSLFGWQDGSFTNLTTQWLPNGANDIEGSGELVSGDFNGDGLTDIFISGNADMDHYVNAYVLMNQGGHVRHQNFWATWQADLTEALAHPLLTLSRSALVLQATVLNGQFLDLLPSFDDGRVSTEVDVGRRYVP